MRIFNQGISYPFPKKHSTPNNLNLSKTQLFPLYYLTNQIRLNESWWHLEWVTNEQQWWHYSYWLTDSWMTRKLFVADKTYYSWCTYILSVDLVEINEPEPTIYSIIWTFLNICICCLCNFHIGIDMKKMCMTWSIVNTLVLRDRWMR